ncbi:hypothetical protein ACMFMG_011340 [Clarireedia jacksonii]
MGNGGATYGTYESYKGDAPANNNKNNSAAPASIPAAASTAPARDSEVRNSTALAPGPDNSIGYLNYGINSITNTICYNIALLNVAGTY